MSQSETPTTVSMDEKIELAPGVASAINRNLGLIANHDAFIDRLHAAQQVVDEICALRYASVIGPEQAAFCVRKVRNLLADNLGKIADSVYPTALEIDAFRRDSLGVSDTLDYMSH